MLDVSKPQSTNLPKNFEDEILPGGEGGDAACRGEARVQWPQFQGSQLDDSEESDEEDNGEPIPVAAESTTTSAVDDHKQVRFSEPSISTSSTTGNTTIVNKNYYFS